MQSTILASVNGRLGRGVESIPQYCVIGQKLPHRRQKQYRWLVDAVFLKLGIPTPPDWATPSIFGTRWHIFFASAPGWNCSFFVEGESGNQFKGASEWQGNQILELKEYLKKHFFPNTAGRMVFWKTKFRSCHILAYNPPPTWNKTRVLTEAFPRPARSDTGCLHPLPGLFLCTPRLRALPFQAYLSLLEGLCSCECLALGVCLASSFSWLSSQVTSSQRFSFDLWSKAAKLLYYLVTL